MSPESKRSVVVVLARAVAHLYAVAAAIALDTQSEEDFTEQLDSVIEMLTDAYGQASAAPECAAVVLEQQAILSSIAHVACEPVERALVLIRSALVLNTWCRASTMLIGAEAANGPLTIAGLLQIVSRLQPDARYQAAVAEQLSASAYDNSAVSQLGSAYFHAYEAHSLLELCRLLGLADTGRAADLLDNASRGVMTAVRFLLRTPLREQDSGVYSPEAPESDEPAEASSTIVEGAAEALPHSVSEGHEKKCEKSFEAHSVRGLDTEFPSRSLST